VTANDTWKNEINTALGLFLTNSDVAAFQAALVSAAGAYGN
jgi:glucose/mannose transport system substrate-binding protein